MSGAIGACGQSWCPWGALPWWGCCSGVHISRLLCLHSPPSVMNLVLPSHLKSPAKVGSAEEGAHQGAASSLSLLYLSVS